MRQVVRVEVDKMLGRFDHVVDFPAEWEFVIIHGPNGVGKTKLLELVSYTFNFRISRLSEIPFKAARFDFDDGSRLRITRVESEAPKRTGRKKLQPSVVDPSYNIHFHLARPHGHAVTWTSGADAQIASSHLRDLVVRTLPLRRIGPDEYHDASTNEVLTFVEVIEIYGHLLPSELYPVAEQPKELREFLSETSVYLIETQRLVNIPLNARQNRFSSSEPEIPKPRVALYSDDLTRRLREALAQNSRRSQELDRRFPGKLLKGSPNIHVTDEQIREKYNRQADYRARLAQIDVLGASSEYLPLPDRELKDWERHVLWAYLEDSELKLETFEDLLARLRLLQEIVNSRFKYKSLTISRDQGFVIRTDDTGQEISPDRLSSGEQHELVLVYDLLFQVKENTLVLIDEPEISLHVGWQRQFMTDLFEISQLTSLRFLIATHSPQIIHKWWERTVPLVPQDEMDDR